MHFPLFLFIFLLVSIGINAHNSTEPGSVVKVYLNVGGVEFITTDYTLSKQDGYFKKLLPLNEDPYHKSIDRDPTHFRVILNFLRDGHVTLPDSPKEVQEILAEAKYYQLDGLVKLCSEYGNPKKYFKVIETDEEYVNVMANPEKTTVIVYFPQNLYGWANFPKNFKPMSIVEKYQGKVDIYFKSKNAAFGPLNTPVWRWSVHSEKFHSDSPNQSMGSYASINTGQRMDNVTSDNLFGDYLIEVIENALSQ